jgi:signal transduction histidine kinase
MGRDPRLWPMLFLLLIVVLLPTACLLWMMSSAIENERAAVRQVLVNAFRSQLNRLQMGWDEHWRDKAAELDRVAAEKPPQERFAAIVRAGLADAVVCCDGQRRPIYPTCSMPPLEQPPETAAWARASQLEFSASERGSRLLEAAQAYAALVEDPNTNLAARAIVAQARCLAKAGRRDQAIAILSGTLAGERFRHAVDASGRSIVADAELRSLELIGDCQSPHFQEIAHRLTDRLNDYSIPSLRSSQRLFLMKALTRLDEKVALPTRHAEELAAEFLESGRALGSRPVVQPSGMHDVWQFASADGRTVALLSLSTIYSEYWAWVKKQGLPSGVGVTLEPPALVDTAPFLHTLPAGDRLPGWQLGLSWNNEQLLNAAVQGKVAAYMLTGLLAVAITAGLALWIALRFLRQMRLTRLKNDLVATVSHELKTPLASIRLLVDTMLAAGTTDSRQAREYLELIAKENARLSRLIDNFLTFSRMERNKRAFSLAPVEPATIVASAVDAVRERFEQSGCRFGDCPDSRVSENGTVPFGARFEIIIQPDLPPVMADADAMTTALVNLLDNAWKYTGDDKHIVLRAYARAEGVCFAVADNGIGLSRSACKKVFQRFYQVDRDLSRSRGGCGLGLSIVEFIVHGHGGRVTVESQPSRGSTFTIALPRGDRG